MKRVTRPRRCGDADDADRLIDGSVVDPAPVIQDDDVTGELRHHVQIVAEEHRVLALVAQLADGASHFLWKGWSPAAMISLTGKMSGGRVCTVSEKASRRKIPEE